MNPRLKEKYNKEIVQTLMTKLNFKNVNAVPKIEKNSSIDTPNENFKGPF